MNDTEQKKDKENQQVWSQGDKTYGEKMHHLVFGTLINFWLNLTVSAGFTYWIFHSKKEIKLPFMKEAARPVEVFNHIRDNIQKLPMVQLFKKEETRVGVATSMAGVLALTSPGHLVMIPGTWIGAKVKTPMVKALNRMHYGAQADTDTNIQAREAAIETEERPTLLGATVGRLGTIVSTQTAAYTLGSKLNIFKELGKRGNIPLLKDFNGIDHLAEEAGAKTGSVVSSVLKGPVEKLNKHLGKSVGYTEAQIKANPLLAVAPYGSVAGAGGAPEHYGRFMFADIMYTIVTTMSIGPAIDFAKKFIPGLTYKPKASPETVARITKQENAQEASAAPMTMAAPEPKNDVPNPRISNITREETVTARNELAPQAG